MKIKTLPIIVFLFSSIIITSCSNKKEVIGRVSSYQNNNIKCWSIRSDSNGMVYDFISDNPITFAEDSHIKAFLKPLKPSETPCYKNSPMKLLSYSFNTTPTKKKKKSNFKLTF